LLQLGCTAALVGAFAPTRSPVPTPARRLRPRYAAPLAQQGPLEEGFKELLPYATEGDNVDPELVERMEREVRELTGVGLEDLLNPSKVVNYERERLLLEAELSSTALDAARREEAQTRLTKVTRELNAEKRTVFRGWLKGVFVGQAVIAIVVGGLAAFDAFPVYTIDISLRALGFWSFWLFVIPSLRARRPKGWEKLALNYAFLGSPVITIGAPFLTKDPAMIWSANLAWLVLCYVYGFTAGRGEGAEEAGAFTGVLRYLDFGSGQERGIRGEARERMFAKQQEQQPEGTVPPKGAPSGERQGAAAAGKSAD